MEFIQVDTSSRVQARQLLHLPFDLYRDVLQWVPPLAPDAWRMLDRRHHPFYRNSDASFFPTIDRGRAAGRLTVLDNTDFNAFNHGRTAFFCLFDLRSRLIRAGSDPISLFFESKLVVLILQACGIIVIIGPVLIAGC